MFRLISLVLIAAVADVPEMQRVHLESARITSPAVVEVPNRPNGLTLYNASGEVVAKCEVKGDAFGKCRMEPGVTLDDLMNAWVHAYMDVQK